MRSVRYEVKQIKYSLADKFVLAENYSGLAPFVPLKDIVTSYGAFYTTGEYFIFRGFLFSANRPAINTEDSIRASCNHDFFYNLMKDGLLNRDYREVVDKLFYEHLIEDGMVGFRALYWWKAVRIGGDDALDSPYPKIKIAPPNETKVAGWQLATMFK